MSRMDDISLDGKVAIVTGAGSPAGIGRAISLALVRAGARVAMVDRNASWLEHSVSDVRDVGGDDCAIGILGDIKEPATGIDAVASTIAHFGSLHILVNNAGTSPLGEGLVAEEHYREADFWKITTETWRRVVDVNLNGTFYVTHAIAPHLIDQGWGRIITVTTSLDTMYRKGYSPYGPSKAGVEAFVAAAAQDLHGSGVTSNVITPGGGTDTNLISPLLSDEHRSRMLRPDVMGPPTVWLASDESADFTGGRIIAARWNQAEPLQSRLADSAAPAAWPQLGKQSVHPDDPR
jgi:NAD(P)-dependent dehydrogenase (short-subunit alcohol dehydrogenase family)